MAETYGDWVAITNSATADAESAASAINIQAGARITKISVVDVATGHTYAVKIDCPSMVSPQKYIVTSNGALANTNGGKKFMGKAVDCDIKIPNSASSVNVSTFADVISATCKVQLQWEV